MKLDIVIILAIHSGGEVLREAKERRTHAEGQALEGAIRNRVLHVQGQFLFRRVRRVTPRHVVGTRLDAEGVEDLRARSEGRHAECVADWVVDAEGEGSATVKQEVVEYCDIFPLDAAIAVAIRR